MPKLYVNHGRNSEIKRTSDAIAVMRSVWDHFFMSKAKPDLLDEELVARGVYPADGWGADVWAPGCCPGGYHFPSEACHQSGPFETSLTLFPPIQSGLKPSSLIFCQHSYIHSTALGHSRDQKRVKKKGLHVILERARDRQRRRPPGTNAGTIRPRKRTLCLYRGDAAIEQTVSVTKVRGESFSEFDYAAFGKVVDRLPTPVAVVAPRQHPSLRERRRREFGRLRRVARHRAKDALVRSPRRP